MATTKGASLNPADFSSGGAVPDGRYTIKTAQAVEFDYGGNAAAVPALCLVLVDGSGTEFTQHYSAGKLENLVPSDNGDEFVHPGGDDAKISKSSNLASFIAAIVNAGFPPNELTAKVTCFNGADVDIVNQAQPKRPGLKDQQEGKTIPLPVKYYGKAKAGKSGARPSPARTAGATTKTPATPVAASPSNGDLDAEAIMRVQEALTNAKDNSLNLVKVKLTVWQLATKAKDANATAYRTLVTPEWLEANAEAGGWTWDGETVALTQ